MRNTLKMSRKKKGFSEEKIDQWLQGVDLATLSPKIKLQRASFPNLKPTNWNKLYEDFQKSRPISIRLPIYVLDKLKQVSLQKGIGYQTLIRLWVTEKLQTSLQP